MSAKSQPDPWSRMPKESAQAFDAMGVYLSMGAGRSHRAVAEKVGRAVSLIERFSRLYGWVERARAYDSHAAKVAQEARDKAAAEREALWAARKGEAADKDWEQGQQLRDVAAKMLGTELHSASWTMATAVTASKTGSDLQERALAVMLDDLQNVDPVTMTPDEAKALVERLVRRAQLAGGGK